MKTHKEIVRKVVTPEGAAPQVFTVIVTVNGKSETRCVELAKRLTGEAFIAGIYERLGDESLIEEQNITAVPEFPDTDFHIRAFKS